MALCSLDTEIIPGNKSMFKLPGFLLYSLLSAVWGQKLKAQALSAHALARWKNLHNADDKDL